MATIKETLHFYIEQLNESQQQRLLAFLKTVVPLHGRITIAQYNKQLNKAESGIEKGCFTAQEDLEEEIKNW